MKINLQSIQFRLQFIIWAGAGAVLLFMYLFGFGAVEGSSQQVEAEAGSQTVYFIAFIVLIVIICLVITFFLNTFLFKPLQNAISFSLSLKNGDFTQSCDRKQRDEMGVLVHSLNQMGKVTANTLGKMSRNGQRIVNNSNDLIAISSELTHGAQLLNKQNQRVEAGTDNLRNTVAQVTSKGEHARESLDIISSAAEEMSATIEEISQSTDHARVTVDDANQNVIHAHSRVLELGKSAQAINNIINVIVEISEQTKLLALNATIEASRAGEAGRGFTVVANEIKELAAQTNEATAEITTQISEITGNTQSTIDEIEKIKEVFGDVKNVVTNIAAAVEEQAVTTREMADNVQGANENVVEVSQSISELNHLTETLESNTTQATRLGSTIFSHGQVVFSKASRFALIGEGFQEIVRQFKVDSNLTDLSQTEEPDLVTWSDDLKLGIEIIDEQHQSLVHLLNNLYWVHKSGKADKLISHILDELIAYSEFHFESEEILMAKSGYKNLESHRKIHGNLIDQVVEFSEQYRQGKKDVDQSLLDFLRDWLVNHINKEDRQYQPAMQAAGY